MMKLEDQFTAAMLAAGNKRSSINSYWPHLVRYIQFTRKRYGNWVHPSETKVEDIRNDGSDNPNGVPVPHAFARKCPSAPNDFRWMWLFPSDSLSHDPSDGSLKRYHRDDDHLRRIFQEAVKRSGVRRRITPHNIRRPAATHLHLAGMPLRRLQGTLGHNSLEVAQLYVFEDEAEINGPHSPFDLLDGID